VRGETERTSTTLDDLRAYYLATGALDKAALEALWSPYMSGEPKLKKGAIRVDYQFPSGMAHVEFFPEASKFDVNHVPLDRLARLLAGLGAEPERIQAIVQGVDAWRSGRGSLFSSLQGPTFQTAATSFQEIEELLAVRGVTPELFYGTYVPATGEPGPGMPRLIRRSGLIDCLSVFGTTAQIDVNGADPAVLFALGMPEEGIRAVMAQRNIAPLDANRLNSLGPLLGAAGPSLRLDGNSIVTIRSTGRVRLPNGQLSDLKRSVAAMVKYMPPNYDSPIHILRWYDTAWTN
jgi:general secretion pathway protein K